MERLVLDASPTEIGEIEIKGVGVFPVLAPRAGDYDVLIRLQGKARKLTRLRDADDVSEAELDEAARIAEELMAAQDSLLPQMLPGLLEHEAWPGMPISARREIVDYAFACVRKWTPAQQRAEDGEAAGESSAGDDA